MRHGIAGERSALHAFVMVLSHSRKPAVVWSRREDDLGWLRQPADKHHALGAQVEKRHGSLSSPTVHTA